MPTGKHHSSDEHVYGPFLCHELLGINSNSVVYRGHHKTTQEAVAVRVMKIIPRPDLELDKHIALCLEELRLITELDIPYLMPLVGYGAENDELYIAMPLLQGRSLQDRIKIRRELRNGSLPSPGETAQLLNRMAIALDNLHQQDVVHGQIEPHNVMFNAKGEGFLADVGLTRLYKQVFGLHSTASFTTGYYASPEQWNGERPTPASDQYSLACIIYELVAGQVPFQHKAISRLMEDHLNNLPEPVHRLRDGVPGGVSMVLMRAMSKDPSTRYQTVTDFYRAFAEALGDFQGEPTDFFTFTF